MWGAARARRVTGLALDDQVADTFILMPVYAWFTEGHDTADLKTAKILLEALDDAALMRSAAATMAGKRSASEAAKSRHRAGSRWRFLNAAISNTPS
jgi:hypothetical protein